MNEGIKKFEELLKNDEAFQQKLQAAVQAYDGEATEEAVFNSILSPLAAEYGIQATYEEYKEYLENLSNQELSVDEMEQIAGGKPNGGGLGGGECTGAGFGGGVAVSEHGAVICVFLGMGWGGQACFAAGYAPDPED